MNCCKKLQNWVLFSKEMLKDFNNTSFPLLVQEIVFLYQLIADFYTGLNFNILIKIQGARSSLTSFQVLYILSAREGGPKVAQVVILDEYLDFHSNIESCHVVKKERD